MLLVGLATRRDATRRKLDRRAFGVIRGVNFVILNITLYLLSCITQLHVYLINFVFVALANQEAPSHKCPIAFGERRREDAARPLAAAESAE